MKKALLLIISVIVLTIVAGIAYFIWNFNNADCPPPERPIGVPTEAKWCGGCDGGEWIFLVPDDIEYHFKVYNNFTGTLLMDAVFLPEKDEIELNYDNWKEKVSFYMSDSDSPLTYIIIKDSIEPSRLISQYPAFGGIDWEITKEKYSHELNSIIQ